MNKLILTASLFMITGYNLQADSRIVNNLNAPVNLVFYNQNFQMPIPSLGAKLAIPAIVNVAAVAAQPAVTGTSAKGRALQAPGTLLAASQDIAIPTTITVAYVGAFTDKDSTYQQITSGQSYTISATNGQLDISQIPSGDYN